MYRTCKCEDFPCCGHGVVDTMEYDPRDSPDFDPFMYEDIDDESY